MSLFTTTPLPALGSRFAGGYGAKEGIILSQTELDARVHALDSDIEATEDRIAMDRKQLLARIKCKTTFPPSKIFDESLPWKYDEWASGDDSLSLEIPKSWLPGKDCAPVPPYTAEEKNRIAFFKDWNNFKLDWNSFKAAGFSGIAEPRLAFYEQRYRQLRATYADMPGAIVPPEPSPPVGDPLDSLYKFVKTVAIVAMVGAAAWYLLPVLLATMKKREGGSAEPAALPPAGATPAMAGAAYGDDEESAW